jgi:hypothetical protein
LGLSALVASTGACQTSAPSEFGLNVTVDARALSVADRGRIASLAVHVSGDEDYSRLVDVSAPIKSGVVRFRYIPLVKHGALTLTVDAVDLDQATVASGRGAPAPVTLTVGAVDVSVLLASAGVVHPDLGSPSDMAVAPASDLAGPCSDGGALCSTGYPGDCNVGHTTCMLGAAACVPDKTMQYCFSGPAGAANQGICRPGIQLCAGTLGTCMGEVLPKAKEDCFNDLDDDCDGVINNGCPDKITVGAGRPLGYVPSDGQVTVPVSARCGADQLVTGVLVDIMSLAILGVHVQCATVAPVRGAGSYTLSFSSTVQKGFDGNGMLTGGVTIDCAPSGGVAWDTYGRAGMGSHGTVVYNAGEKCAAVTPSFDGSTNVLSFSVAANGVMNSGGYSQTPTFELPCNADEVLIGYDGNVGDYLDRLQPVCAKLLTVYK